MNTQTWVASGHLGSFSDPLMECRDCHERFRADKVIEDFCAEKGIELEGSCDGWSDDELMSFAEKTDEQRNKWCYYDMLRRGVIEI